MAPTPEPSAPKPAEGGSTTLEDPPEVTISGERPVRRIRRPGDGLRLAATLVGTALALGVGAVAKGTTVGLSSDIARLGRHVPGVLLTIAASATQLVLLVTVLVVLGELLLGRRLLQLAEAVVAVVLGAAVGAVVNRLVESYASPDLLAALTVGAEGGRPNPAAEPLVVGIAALLTAAGPRSRRPLLATCWWVVWVTLGLSALAGHVAVLSTILTLLLGRAAGLSIRYAGGTITDRPYGASLVAALHRAGIAPSSVVPVSRQGDVRRYLVETTAGERVDVAVMDADQQGAGTLARLWRAVRLRGPVDRRAVLSLRQAAEREALMSYAVTSAGVRTPHLVSVADAGGSAVLIATEHVTGSPLLALPRERVTDALLCDVWTELSRLRRHNLAHRGFTGDTVIVDDDGRPWLVGLGSGELAASDLHQRLDVAQALAVLALAAGPERAVRSGADVLGIEELSDSLPLLQPLALPPDTRRRLRVHRRILPELRQAILSLAPAADTEPERLERFGPRTVITAVAGTVAAYLLLTQIGSVDVLGLLSKADPAWLGVALVASLLSYVGATMSMLGFTPQPLPFWRTTAVQVATSFVNLMAPAGVGAAALNARYLGKRGVPAGLAVATVGLIQLSNVVSTVALLVVLSAATGRGEGSQFLPGRTTLAAIGAVLVLAALTLAVPRVRAAALRRIGPAARQTIPRLLDVLQQPVRLVLGLGGNLVVTAGYLIALEACLRAFGASLSAPDLAVVFLASQAVGSLVPTPGGLGAIEAALVAGLSTAGVVGGVAVSATLLFRALTFWLRVPPGYLVLSVLQRRGSL